MPINPALLIAAPMLQDLLVDANGIPMAAGTITLFQDTSRTTLKNWYYQSGTTGDYTFSPLPNPLTLSAAGTICDINGVDTIPFFYPYDENDETKIQRYFILIQNAPQTYIITRQNFPYNVLSSSGIITTSSLDNLIINNGFWRNAQPNSINATPYTAITLGSSQIIAPSQHDGYTMPDIMYIQTNSSGTDKLTFTPFPLLTAQPITGDIVPEFYINHDCTAIGSGQTSKVYQFPISLHVNQLAATPFTVTLQAQNDPTTGQSGAGQNVIYLTLLTYTGTGGTAVTATPIGIPFNLDQNWTTYSATGQFPQTTGLTLGNGEDDAYYLQVNMPIGVAFSINFTKPCLYLTTNLAATNEIQTYDQVAAIINSSRTGDIRTSLNSFYPYGWLPMNNGTIGGNFGSGGSSGATTRANNDVWPLYKLIYNIAQPYDSGSTFNPLAQLYNSSGSSINYTTTDIASFNGKNRLALTKMLGQVIMGTVPISAMLTALNTSSQVVTFSNLGGVLLATCTSVASLYVGQPIVFTTTGTFPAGLSASVFYITNINPFGAAPPSFELATTYANAVAYTPIAAGGLGTGTFTMVTGIQGASTGQNAHLQLLAELVNHQHLGPADTTLFDVNNGIANVAAGAGVSCQSANPATAITGDVNYVTNTTVLPFNVTQPGTFYNIYIKM